MPENNNIRKNFLLVEPDNNTIYPMEEYNILVDLIVRNSPRMPNKEVEELSFILGTYKFTKDGINENDAQNTMIRDYSTSYLDVSANEIFNDSVNRECLGVDSIDIDYSNWQYPQVSIKFTDVRAQALMMPEESLYVESLVNETYKAENNKTYTYEGYSAEKKANSLFTSFFRFPYPEFILKVKGFYGHAISFRLTVNEFTSSFNSDTGNFDITVSFIGHLYGFLTDIPMRYIMLAPYIDGKKYWNGEDINENGEKNHTPFTFDGTTPVPTILELARQILNANDKLFKLSNNDEDLKEYKNQQKKINSFTNIIKEINNIQSLLNVDNIEPTKIEKYFDNLISICQEHPSNSIDNDIKKILIKTDKFNNTIDLIEYFKYCKQLFNGEVDENTEVKQANDSINLSTIKKISSDISNSQKEKIISNFLRIVRNNIKVKINEIEKNNKENTQKLSEKLTQNIVEILGFKPTIENIFKIIFAHIDTFIYHYNDCIKIINDDITNNNRIKLNEKNSDVVSINGEETAAPPFPLIHSGEKNNGEREREILYPTHDDNIAEGDMPELVLVDKMLDGASKLVANINTLFSFVDKKTTTLPITIIDIINQVNPYGFYKYENISKITGDNYSSIIDDSLTVLFLRSILYNLLNHNVKNTQLLETIGQIEAYNFFYIHNNSDERIINGIIEKTNNKEEIYNFINKNGNKFINGDFVKTNILSDENTYDWIKDEYEAKDGIPVCFKSKTHIIDSFRNDEDGNDAYFETFLGAEKNKYDFYIFENDNTSEEFINLYESIENNDNLEISYKNDYIDSLNRNTFNNYKDSKASEISTIDLVPANDTHDNKCKLPNKYFSENDEYNGGDFSLVNGSWHTHTNLVNITNENSLKNVSYRRFFDYSSGNSELTKILLHLYFSQNEITQNASSELITTNKAFLFLYNKCYKTHTLKGKKNEVDTDNPMVSFLINFVKNDNNIHLSRISNLTLLHIGSMIWHYEDNSGLKYFIPDNIYESMNENKKNEINKVVKWVKLFYENYADRYLNEHTKCLLKDYFKEWAINIYGKNYIKFELTQKENNIEKNISYEEYVIMLNSINEKWGNGSWVSSGMFSGSTYIPPTLKERDSRKYSNFLYEILGENVLENYDYAFKDDFILNPNKALEMTQDLLKDVYIYRPYNVSWENISNKTLNTDNIKKIFTSFNSKIKELKNKEDKNNKVSDMDTNNEAKLSLYLTLKNLYDKWKCNIFDKKDNWKCPKNMSLINNYENEYQKYNFIDSRYNNIGDEILVDCNYLIEYINTILKNPKSNLSLYEFMYQIANSCNMLMLTLPISNYLNEFDAGKMENTFKPNFKLMSAIDSDLEGSTHLCIYNDLPSSNLDIGNQIGDYEYTNDGTDISNTLNMFYYDTDGNVEKTGIPCFMVNFGQQNQSLFKNIRINMDNPQETEYSIAQQFYIANKYGDGASNQVFYKGQNMFNVYSNHSYTCTIDMMGCANITPCMHFYLNNIPLFKGVYMIISVKHHIEAGNMITTFTGVRQNINKLPFTKDALYLSKFKDKIDVMETKSDIPNYDFNYTYNANLFENLTIEVVREKVVKLRNNKMATIGKMFINGRYFCDTLEDNDRGLNDTMELGEISRRKEYGETAIPSGEYEVSLRIPSKKFSANKYKKWTKFAVYAGEYAYLPRLLNVKGFDGVLIHVGNKHTDTEGCLLVGKYNWNDDNANEITESQNTFKELMEEIYKINPPKNNFRIRITRSQKCCENIGIAYENK